MNVVHIYGLGSVYISAGFCHRLHYAPALLELVSLGFRSSLVDEREGREEFL
jgi:hypothetical protein